LRNLDYFFGLGACHIQRSITDTIMTKLRIEEVPTPPGSTAITSGCDTAPDAISNVTETIQKIIVLLQSALCCFRSYCGSGVSFSK